MSTNSCCVRLSTSSGLPLSRRESLASVSASIFLGHRALCKLPLLHSAEGSAGSSTQDQKGLPIAFDFRNSNKFSASWARAGHRRPTKHLMRAQKGLPPRPQSHQLPAPGLPRRPWRRRNFKKNPEVRVGKREENTIVFMEISIGPRKVGRLEIELRRDLCPLTCENFRQLITGERGTIRETDEHGNSRCINLHYKGSRMCRVVRDSHCQGGDIANGNGTWSRSIFKRGDFPDENFILRHTGAGCLSMCNRGLDSNGSQFFFTFAAKPEWDERHVVFGVLRNRESLRTLFAIDQVGSQFGKPSQEVIISDCGQLWPPHHTQQKKKFTSRAAGARRPEQRVASPAGARAVSLTFVLRTTRPSSPLVQPPLVPMLAADADARRGVPLQRSGST